MIRDPSRAVHTFKDFPIAIEIVQLLKENNIPKTILASNKFILTHPKFKGVNNTFLRAIIEEYVLSSEA